MLIEQLLGEKEVTLIDAYPKSGVSALLSDISVSVIDGKPFINHETSQGTVLYVLGDDLDTIKELYNGYDTENGSNLIFTNDDDLEEIEATLEENHFDLVLIDKVERLVDSSSEFNYEKIKQLIERLRSFDCSVILSTKREQSEQLKEVIDNFWHLERGTIDNVVNLSVVDKNNQKYELPLTFVDCEGNKPGFTLIV